jgi:hypothetical protein
MCQQGAEPVTEQVLTTTKQREKLQARFGVLSTSDESTQNNDVKPEATSITHTIQDGVIAPSPYMSNQRNIEDRPHLQVVGYNYKESKKNVINMPKKCRETIKDGAEKTGGDNSVLSTPNKDRLAKTSTPNQTTSQNHMLQMLSAWLRNSLPVNYTNNEEGSLLQRNISAALRVQNPPKKGQTMKGVCRITKRSALPKRQNVQSLLCQLKNQSQTRERISRRMVVKILTSG